MLCLVFYSSGYSWFKNSEPLLLLGRKENVLGSWSEVAQCCFLHLLVLKTFVRIFKSANHKPIALESILISISMSHLGQLTP